MFADRRRLSIVGAVIIMLASAVWYQTRPVAPASETAVAPRARVPRSKPGVVTPDGVTPIRLDTLQAGRSEPSGTTRNPFRFQPKVVAPPPRPVAPTPEMPRPVAPPVTAGPPPAPPIPLKFIALVERAQGGDQRAFEMLVIKYQRRVERLIGRMVRDVDLVQDIAQESFIRAYRALPKFRGDSAFYTWLYRIVVNTAKKALVELKRDLLVSEATLAGSHDEDDETSRVDREPSMDATPESLLASKQVAQAVNAAIDALSPDLRRAIMLREIEGLSYEEIAEMMDSPIGTVRSRIFRAREFIALRLRPLLDTRDGERW